MKTAVSSPQPPRRRRHELPLVTVETNEGGYLLLAAVRKALVHLPVRVESATRTTGRTRS